MLNACRKTSHVRLSKLINVKISKFCEVVSKSFAFQNVEIFHDCLT